MTATLTKPREAPEKVAVPSLSMVEAGELPIEQLVAFAIREGRRPRPIYTAHKWFARRLGSVFRSLLIGTTNAPGADFNTLYYGDADLTGVTVLDPFVGGGTSVFEASRLGAQAYGCDVDPVACAVSRMELAAADIPDLQPTLDALLEKVGKVLAPFHRDGDEIALHHFWVQQVDCPACAAKFDAHPSYILADEGKIRHAICSGCGEIAELAPGTAEFDCEKCDTHTVCASGNVDRKGATCPSCGHNEQLIAAGRRNGAPQWRLFAVETIPQPSDKRIVPMTGRTLRAATDADARRFEEAKAALAAAEAAGEVLLPDDGIDTTGWSDGRLTAYGYRKWRDLFNERQLLHLGLLAKEISKLEQPVRNAVAMAFSDHLTTNCMMASYAGGWRRLTPLFSLRAFRHIQRPVELNPWIDRTGRGTFPNAIRKLAQAAAYARKPKEPSGAKEFVEVETRAVPSSGSVHLGTARNLAFLADASVDVVMTDPPYFDNIAYSELAQFFAPWLRLLSVVEEREQSEILANSLVAKKSKADSVTRYTEGLAAAFGEISRVLKKDGIVAFSYRHTEAPAWLALAKAIAATTLRVTSVLPMPGEAGNGLHAQGERGLWDAVFILRQGDSIEDPRALVVSEEQVEAVERDVAAWLERYGKTQIPFNRIDAAALRRAALVGRSLSAADLSTEDNCLTLEEILG